VCSLFLLATTAKAQSTFTVTNTDDSGVGSLPFETQVSNETGGSNTILWSGPQSGGTISLTSDLSINGNTTLNVTNAASAVTIAGSGPVSLGGAVTFDNGNTFQVWTISDAIEGLGSLTKTGAGTLVLTGINTYTGGTFLDGGILNVNGDAALGNASGGLTFNVGTLQTAASMNSARSIT